MKLCKTSDCAGWGGVKLKSANGQDWKIIEKWYKKLYDIIDFFGLGLENLLHYFLLKDSW